MRAREGEREGREGGEKGRREREGRKGGERGRGEGEGRLVMNFATRRQSVAVLSIFTYDIIIINYDVMMTSLT